MAAAGMAPFAELCRQSLVFVGQGLGLESEQALMHLIQGVVDQLGGLFGIHGTAGEGSR